MSGRILLVDLNNEAAYPTLAIGYLKAPLVAAGFEVDVFSPLAHGMKPLARDRREGLFDYAVSRLLFAGSPLIEWANEWIYTTYNRVRFRATRSLRRSFEAVLRSGRYDGVMVSSYLQYYPMMVAIAALAKRQGVPLLLGGPYFNQPEVAKDWLKIDGVSLVFGGEADFIMPQLAEALISGNGLDSIEGLFRNGSTEIEAAAPIALTDELPVPDFDHFAWDDHPYRVLPVMAGRGCAWGKCLFCSDVTTASTRTFRTRSLEAVLEELSIQSERYRTNHFIFFDSKLNSDLVMWNGLIERIQSVVPGATWVASVHVDGKGENGLSGEELERAHDAGLRRITFGLESGSDRLNRQMVKGTSMERTQEFVEAAHGAGVSIRTTIILGYPGETAEDVQATADFLRENRQRIDRVKLCKFKAIPGTPFQERFARRPEKYPSVRDLHWDYRFARGVYRYEPENKSYYRKSKTALLEIVHRINRKEILESAKQFDGLM